MATYQITCFALTPDGSTGVVFAPNQLGLRFPFAMGAAQDVLVEGAATGLQVSRGSPCGQAGQPVTLGARVRVSRAGGEAVPEAFRMLELDGDPVGLVAQDAETGALVDVVGAGPLQVEAIEAAGGGPPLVVPVIDAEPPTGPASSRPRRCPFAFRPGTLIDTLDGPRPVESLQPGDLTSTLDNGTQPVRWVGRRVVPVEEMALREDLRPLRLEVGVLGNARPLLVSPRHRILLNDWRAQVYFGEDQVLVPAQALLNGETVRQVLPLAGLTYIHLLFDRHEVILAEGALSESLHPGENGLGAFDAAQRQEIEALFPDRGVERRRAAFPMLRMAEARSLRLPG